MNVTRRDFLKAAAASAAALGLSRVQLTRLETALAASSRPPVIWLSGQACTGCSVSLLNAVNPTIDQVLLNTISLNYHPNVMAAAGDLAVAAARSTAQAGGYILVVEGAIPTASSGRYCYVWDEGGRSVTMADAVASLAATAQFVVAVGTCASFGGIPLPTARPAPWAWALSWASRSSTYRAALPPGLDHWQPGAGAHRPSAGAGLLQPPHGILHVHR